MKLLMAKFRKNKAFTLVETLITLVIAIGLISIGTYELKGYKDKQAINQSSRELKLALEHASRCAVISQKYVWLSYNTETNIITVSNRMGVLDKFKLPKEVKVYGLNDINISTSYTQPKTITLKTSKYTKVLTIQLEWGKIIEK